MREWLTELLFWLIKRCNAHKSKRLSQQLLNLAENYNERPGTMNYYYGKR